MLKCQQEISYHNLKHPVSELATNQVYPGVMQPECGLLLKVTNKVIGLMFCNDRKQ